MSLGGDVAEAVRVLNKSVRIARGTKDHLEECKSHRDLFQIYLDSGQFSTAAQEAASERATAEAAKDTRGEMASCIRLAVALANGGDLVKSLAVAEEACDLSQAGGDRRSKARALRVVSDIHRLDSRLEAALEASEERLKIARDLGDLSLEAAAMQELADLHLAESNFHEARHLAADSRDLCRKAGDRPGLVHALLALTEVALASRETANVKEALLRPSAEAVAVAGKLGDEMLRSRALYWRAHALGAVGRYSKAGCLAQEAVALLRKLGDLASQLRCQLLVAELYFAEGLREESLEAGVFRFLVAKEPFPASCITAKPNLCAPRPSWTR